MVKKFKDFENNRLNENSELGWLMVGGSPSSPMGNPIMQHVDDRNLTNDGYDRFNLQQKTAVDRLSHMLGYLFNFSNVNILNSQIIDDLKALKILRMIRNNSGTLDIFVAFIIEEEEYYGVLWNYGGMMPPEFISEVQRSLKLNRDQMTRLNGLLCKCLEKYFIDCSGSYTCLTNSVRCTDYMGCDYLIKKNTKIHILDVNLDANDLYIEIRVHISKNNVKDLYIKGLDVYYFKYWFQKIDVIDDV